MPETPDSRFGTPLGVGWVFGTPRSSWLGAGWCRGGGVPKTGVCGTLTEDGRPATEAPSGSLLLKSEQWLACTCSASPTGHQVGVRARTSRMPARIHLVFDGVERQGQE